MKNNSLKVLFAACICSLGVMFSCGQVYATETDETETTQEEDETVDEGLVSTELPTPTYDIPDSADFSYEDVLYKPIDHYDSQREPMNGERISVNYKGEVVPAYYWAPGDLVVFQVSLADTDIPKFEELSQEDQDTWKSFLSDAYATPAEAYYAEMLPTYTFYFDFDENKIVPFVEFDYGKDGKVVMMPYDMEDQGFYLEELSVSFLKLGNFEFPSYQFLSINDDTCYHILSCMDQVGKVYLYQYDANGNSCARADLNMLIGLRYLAERTIALNEYIDKVQAYQDNIRKIIAGVIIFVVVIGFAFIYVVFGKRKKNDDDDDDDEEDDDDEDELEEEKLKELEEIDEEIVAAPIENELDLDALEKEYGVAEEVAEDTEEETVEETAVSEINIDEIKIEEPVFDDIDVDKIVIEEPVFEEEEMSEIEELSDDGFVPEFEGEDPTEGGLFFAADTEEMKNLFKESDEEPKRGRLRAFLNGDDIEDDDEDDEDDDEDMDEFFPEVDDKQVAEENSDEVQSEVKSEEEIDVPAHEKKTLASVFDDDDEDEEEEEKPRRAKKEKKVKEPKEKKTKEKKVKVKPEKKKHHEEEDEEDAGDDEILDLEDL